MRSIGITVTPQAARHAKTALSLYAAAYGCSESLQRVRAELGCDYGYGEARELFHVERSGIRVGMPGDDADVILDPTDAASSVRHDAPLVLRRSAAPGDLTFPAFPRRETVLLSVKPAARSEKPLVGFCGLASRPRRRRQFVALYCEHDGIDMRLVERQQFMAREIPLSQATAEYVANLIDCQYQLCPIGVGRFSYRYYEALAAGRVPVVDSWHADTEHDVAIKRLLSDGPEALCRQHPMDFAAVCEHNRAEWLRCHSPFGWLTRFAAVLRERFKL